MRRGVGTRKRGVTVALVIVAVIGLMAVLPGLAAADPVMGTWHRANPPAWFPYRTDGVWMSLLDSSGGCLSTISMSAGVDFFVAHGYWAFLDNANPIPQNKDLMNPTTEFRLYVDGVQTHPAQGVWVQALSTETGSWWFVVKMYISSFKGGMADTHVFTGEWYNLGTFEQRCQATVTFS